MQSRKRLRKDLKSVVRKILMDKYGLAPGRLTGYQSLKQSILYVRPELKAIEGYALLSTFAGVAPIPPKINKKKPDRRAEYYTQKVESDAFLESFEWRRLRMQILKRDGAKCSCCGATPADGRVMNVDHIKPRRKYPEMALDPSNLQVLCSECNHGKGNWDETDWRQQYSEASIGAKLRVIK